MRPAFALAATMIALAGCANAAGAQDFPTQTIKLVVPFLAGGPVDALARVSRQHLQEPARPERHHREPLRRRHHHRRQGGRGGGARRLHAALHRPEHGVLPGAVSRSRFRSDEGAGAGRDRRHLVAPDRGGAIGAGQDHSGAGGHAKANPGKLAFGFGLATMPHIIGETFKQAAGIDIINVPYRGGEQARADLLGGRDPHQRRAGAAICR